MLSSNLIPTALNQRDQDYPHLVHYYWTLADRLLTEPTHGEKCSQVPLRISWDSKLIDDSDVLS